MQRSHEIQSHFYPARYHTERVVGYWLNSNSTSKDSYGRDMPWIFTPAIKKHLWNEVVHLRGEDPNMTSEELLSKGADLIREVVQFAQLEVPEDPGTSWGPLILAARDATFGRVSITEARLTTVAGVSNLEPAIRATAHLVHAYRSGVYPRSSMDQIREGADEIPLKAVIVKERRHEVMKAPEDGIVDAEDHMHTSLYYLATALVARMSPQPQS